MAADELNPPRGTTTPEIFLDNVKRADRLVNGPEATVDDRGGKPLETWRQMMAKNDEVRQNLIPLSKQYQTLAAAQADIANIPVGSTTYYRSPEDSALAVKVINNAGTLQPTGRKCPPSRPWMPFSGQFSAVLMCCLIRSANCFFFTLRSVGKHIFLWGQSQQRRTQIQGWGSRPLWRGGGSENGMAC
ncbi:hypothetical protein [Raoultella ornithinolytica]|uniref:hypothetical protein n=1 Tax=Raoultella ornithinolytica TaxID=54291 RepID=UPI000F6C9A02|nr:hypothetical protein [Raoultella ornithinolytica]VEB73622.1 flagellar biosynthesis, cell-distal portion of basal-body rod [Raoultella ornithinolytica]